MKKTLQEEKRRIRQIMKIINEQRTYEDDPEPDEYNGWEFNKYGYVTLISTHNGEYEIDWEFLLPEEMTEDEIGNIIDRAKADPDDPELKKQIDHYVQKYLNDRGYDIKWDYWSREKYFRDDPPERPDDYRKRF